MRSVESPKGRAGAAKAAIVTALVAAVVSGCSLLPTSVQRAVGSISQITAYFDSSAGLFVDNTVSVLGMPVGRIKQIDPAGERVKVTMTFDADIDIPEDVSAVIVNTSLVTTRHLELTPPYTGGPKLKDGAVVVKTKTPVEIDNLLKTLDTLTKDLGGDGQGHGPVKDFLDLGAGMFGGQGDRLRRALNDLTSAVQITANNSPKLAEVIKRLEKLLTVLANNQEKMKAFSRDVTSLFTLLGDQSVGLEATVRSLNGVLGDLSTFLSQNKATLGGALGRLASTLKNLGDYSRQAVELVNVAPLTFSNIANAVSKEQRALRIHVLTDKDLLDGEMVNMFCERVQMRKEGCRTGKLKDFGPDFGILAAMMGLTR